MARHFRRFSPRPCDHPALARIPGVPGHGRCMVPGCGATVATPGIFPAR